MHAEFGQENFRKEQLGRPRCRWVYRVKAGVKELGSQGVEWIQLTQ